MEIKIPKEVRAHKETIFFGLTARQFFCAVLAVALAVGVYFLLKSTAGQETASWACIVAAAPVALAGFFSYHGMALERFALAFLKSQVFYAAPRVFRAENIYRRAMNGKGGHDDA